MSKSRSLSEISSRPSRISNSPSTSIVATFLVERTTVRGFLLEISISFPCRGSIAESPKTLEKSLRKWGEPMVCSNENFKKKSTPFRNPCQNLREPLIIINLSLPRRRESSDVKSFWIPAFAGMTFLEVALNYKEGTHVPGIANSLTLLAAFILFRECWRYGLSPIVPVSQ